MKYIFYVFFFPLLICWLAIACVMALLGSFVKNKSNLLETSVVLSSETVCKLLYQKNLLLPREYDFETLQVASIYDQDTFRGYLFITAPVVYILTHTSYLDVFMLFLVRKWMKVHHDRFTGTGKAYFYEHWLARFCAALARGTGRVLKKPI